MIAPDIRRGRSALSKLLLALALAFPFAAAGQSGSLLEWGYTFGSLTIPGSASNVVAISAGTWHNLVLRDDGRVICWDRDGNEQPVVPVDLSNVVAVAGGYLHDIALRADGTVAAWGDDYFSQIEVPAAATNVVAIAAGVYHSLALRRDGTMVAWGGNHAGIDYVSGATVIPPEATNIVMIAAGGSLSLALRGDGTLLAWGDNRYGQASPLPATTNLAAFSTGGDHCLALRADGTVLAWGFNHNGETNVPASATNVVAIAAGGAHSVALRADGTVVAWGNDYYGQTDIPSNATNVVAITAGSFHTLALQRDVSTQLPPRIWQSPADTTVVVPQAASLYSAALGSLPLSYQWYFKDALLPGQTNKWIEFESIRTNQAGPYYVRVTNDFGSVTSAVATLTVLVPVAIQAEPASQDIVRGNMATFTVTATGDLPLAYRWQKDGADVADGGGVAGATSPTLTIAAVQTNDAGGYRVVITNVANAVTSTVATLTVLVPSTITAQPASQSVPAGSNVTFTVTAIGTPPLAFQWRFGQTNLPGATNLSVSFTNVQSANAGAYDFVVSNAYGVATSAVATLTVVPSAPLITVPPQSQVVSRGQAVSFNVSARGTEPLGCQWQKNGTNLDGATGFSLSLTNVSPEASGLYRAVVGNTVGLTPSADASLVVVPVIVWGQTSYGVMALSAGATNVVAIAVASILGGLPGPLPSSSPCLVLRTDGVVVGWGAQSSGLRPVPASATNIVAIAAGGRGVPFALALRADGTVIGWGSNSSGQTNMPAAATNVAAIAAGGSHALALRTNGTVMGWGRSSEGQLVVPVSASNVVAIAAGAFHSLALRVDGIVVAWGQNTEAQTNVPANATNVIAIAAGDYHSLALRADGTVIGWGRNTQEQTTVPASVTNVIAIAAGASHSLALRADGTVVGWGLNTSGQTTVPVNVTDAVAIAAGGDNSMALLRQTFIGLPPPVIIQPACGTNGFSFSFSGLIGVDYVIEYSDQPRNAAWLELARRRGAGVPVVVIDPATLSASRFYRVRISQP
jgi:alpha-tubulin suppressor-like RCC1 family protein